MGLKEDLDNASVEDYSEVLVRGVIDYETFCDRLDECLRIRDLDLTSEDEINVSTDRFLEAMTAWLRTTNGGDGCFVEPNEKGVSWKDLIHLIYASVLTE